MQLNTLWLTALRRQIQLSIVFLQAREAWLVVEERRVVLLSVKGLPIDTRQPSVVENLLDRPEAQTVSWVFLQESPTKANCLGCQSIQILHFLTTSEFLDNALARLGVIWSLNL